MLFLMFLPVRIVLVRSMFFADGAAVEVGPLYLSGTRLCMGEDLRRKFEAARRYRHSRGMVGHCVMQRGSKVALGGIDGSRIAWEMGSET